MPAPQGYVALDLVGFTDKGDYAAGTTYAQNDLVHSDNRIYLSLQDNNVGQALPVSPDTETEFWKLWLSGGGDDLEALTAEDTSNVTGSGAGQVVVAQALIDAIANKVMNDLVAKSQIINNLLATQTGNVLDATQGKALKNEIDQLNSDMQNLSDENVYKGIVNSGDAFTYIKSLTIPLGGKVYIAFSNECTNIPTQYSWWAVEVYNIENNFVAIATGTWSPNDQYYAIINPSYASTEYEWKKYVTNADFTQYVFEKTNVSIPASGDVTLDFDMSRSGYRAIGVVGFASSSSYAAFSRVQTTFSENKVSVTLRNTSSNQITTIARIQVLYVPA